tara:strand:+ start:1764 stop:2987 length:1224 start_codon:yes stop_codon:yes gene_type:complete
MDKLIIAIAIIFTHMAFAAPVHIDLEAPSEVYRQHLAKAPKSKKADHPAVTKALVWGNRLAEWLVFENSRRTADRQLRLTSTATRRGIPIDSPSIYSEKTIEASLNEHAGELPAVMFEVLNGDKFPNVLPLSDADFVVMARKVDRTYQSAARFKALLPWIESYKRNKAEDVRAYYFFKENNWTPKKFESFDTFSNDLKSELRFLLSELCLNSGETSLGCKRSVASAERAKKMPELFEGLMISGETNWNKFFVIPDFAARRDITWNLIDSAEIPFNTPEHERFIPYLRNNIQDEFRFNDWSLKLRFGSFANGPRLKFETGTVPHVDRLGGNNITMDSNQSIEEYESQWIIRHEFGHVLGLPDCYHEFYDESLKAFVNYQLDTTDLMCSRAGNMNERIHQELQRVYFNP